MNPTSRAIFQSVISSDPSLTGPERTALERLLRGETGASVLGTGADPERLLLSQKKAAKLLDVSRVTIWRMAKASILHPVEILPGTWRYPYWEIAALAQHAGESTPGSRDQAVPLGRQPPNSGAAAGRSNRPIPRSKRKTINPNGGQPGRKS